MPCFVLYLLGYYSIGDYYIIVCLTQRVTEIWTNLYIIKQIFVKIL